MQNSIDRRLYPRTSRSGVKVNIQRFARRATPPSVSDRAGPRQVAKLRAAGRRPPWNLTRKRASEQIRALAPAAGTQYLVDRSLHDFQRRWKVVHYPDQIRRRVEAVVRRAHASGVPSDVIEYEAARYADALTRKRRGRAGNLALEDALEGLGLNPDRFFMRGLRY